jgi:ParB-like chromosome segregation protein Spo0J
MTIDNIGAGPALVGTRNEFPPLDADTQAGLRASIERFGVLVPIVVDLEGNILDGHHRLAICTELKVQYPLTIVVPMPTLCNLTADEGVKVEEHRKAIYEKINEACERFELADEGKWGWVEVDLDADLTEVARTLNLDRRHLSAEQRRSLVAELRSEGKSIRAIATATGVSKTQVTRDIKQVYPGGTPDPDAPVLRNFDEPTKVTGIDGKTYKSKSKLRRNGKKKPTAVPGVPAEVTMLRVRAWALSNRLPKTWPSLDEPERSATLSSLRTTAKNVCDLIDKLEES